MLNTPDIEWLTLNETAQALAISSSKVRRLVEDKVLVGMHRAGDYMIPADFVNDGAILTGLRGTLFVLSDAGLRSEESLDWLLSYNDAIGQSPVSMLKAGHKAEVRRVAQALG